MDGQKKMASLTSKSVFLSLILRHKPEVVGLTLDPNGWVNVNDLIEAVKSHKKGFTLRELLDIVNRDEKGRYSIRNNGSFIRANQGHSAIEIEFDSAVPPTVLYHGTAKNNIPSIMSMGLTKQSRHHVHLTSDYDTAVAVGRRHGSPIVLTIAAERMVADGTIFYLSENGVWLVGGVSPEYIT